METIHTRKYMDLRDCAKEILTYQKGVSIYIDRYAKMFLMHLMDVNTQYHTFRNSILSDKEAITVQKWINRITGNKNVNKVLRKAILDECLQFNEMIEVIRASLKLEPVEVGK